MIALASLTLATIAFVGSHFALSHPLRLRLVGALGEAGFMALYVIVSVATLGCMIFAYEATEESEPFWIAPGWWWVIASFLMLVALVLLVGAFVRNPALPHPGAQPKIPATAKGVLAITRHPMNWAVALWGLVHISVWATPPDLVVAIGILVLAIAGSIGQDRKKERTIGQLWLQWEAKTSFIPFGALLTRRARWRDAAPGWIACLGGFVLWLAIVTYHVPSVSPIVWVWQTFL